MSITETKSQNHTSGSFLKLFHCEAFDQTSGCLSCEDLQSNYLDRIQEISMEIIAAVCPVQNNIRTILFFSPKLCMHNFGIRFYFSPQGSLATLAK